MMRKLASLENTDPRFPLLLQYHRIQCLMTLKQAAEALGLTVDQLRDMELGRAVPSQEQMRRCCSVFK